MEENKEKMAEETAAVREQADGQTAGNGNSEEAGVPGTEEELSQECPSGKCEKEGEECCDPDGDKKLSGILYRGIVYLDRIAGKPLDYMAEGDARGLLFDYVRYVRAGALNEFLVNYLPELQALQITVAGEVQDEATNV